MPCAPPQRELLALLRDVAVRRRVEMETRIYQEIPATRSIPHHAAVRERSPLRLEVLELSSAPATMP